MIGKSGSLRKLLFVSVAFDPFAQTSITSLDALLFPIEMISKQDVVKSLGSMRLFHIKHVRFSLSYNFTMVLPVCARVQIRGLRLPFQSVVAVISKKAFYRLKLEKKSLQRKLKK